MEKAAATTARSVHTQLRPGPRPGLESDFSTHLSFQWVENGADTAEVTGFVSQGGDVEKHLHI